MEVLGWLIIIGVVGLIAAIKIFEHLAYKAPYLPGEQRRKDYDKAGKTSQERNAIDFDYAVKRVGAYLRGDYDDGDLIYLDNAATTKIEYEVQCAMRPYLNEKYGNAGSMHKLGREAAEAIECAREQVANLIGARPDQIIFTSSGTEANNLAILGCKEYLEKIGKKHIITSPTEHMSVLNAVKSLCKNEGFSYSYAELDSVLPGVVCERASVDVCQLTDMIAELQNEVGLVSIMYENNETGEHNFDLERVGTLCHDIGALFHVDCVQAASGNKLNVRDINCDFLSLSSHKIGGPKGVGALYVRDKRYLTPIINGGAGQEFGLRGGTENVAAIVGFGKACELAQIAVRSGDIFKIRAIREHFREELEKRMWDYNLDKEMNVNGTSSGKILSVTFKGIDAQTLVLMLESKGVYVSAGSACNSQESKPSHVLKAIGLSDEDAMSTIRLSFSLYNTEEQVERAAEIITDCVATLKGLKDDGTDFNNVEK